MSQTQATIKPNGTAGMTPALLEDFGPQGTLSVRGVISEAKVTSVAPVVQSTVAVLPAETRYPSPDAMSRVFGTALKLLREAEENAERALEAAKEGDELGADDATYAIKPLLPELFCCRQLGEGFGLIVSGLLSAFQNLSGQAMNVDQIKAVAACIRWLRVEPRASLESADDQIATLEAVGLNPDPAGIEDLVGAIIPDERSASE